jgi:hypothetical protein
MGLYGPTFTLVAENYMVVQRCRQVVVVDVENLCR